MHECNWHRCQIEQQEDLLTSSVAFWVSMTRFEHTDHESRPDHLAWSASRWEKTRRDRCTAIVSGAMSCKGKLQEGDSPFVACLRRLFVSSIQGSSYSKIVLLGGGRTIEGSALSNGFLGSDLNHPEAKHSLSKRI